MKKVKHYISHTKNIESINNLTVVMALVFEMSSFKRILKYVCANDSHRDLHNTRLKLLIDKPCARTNTQQEKCNYSLSYVNTVLL